MSEDSQSSKNVASKYPQYISATIAGLSGFASGIALCPLLLGSSYNENISFRLYETNNLQYLNIFGAVVGTLVSGFVSDSLGPKRAIQISAFPLFMSRLITAYCRTVYGFYAAILLHGFAAGISLFSAINYSIDIAERRQRGSVAFMYYALHILGIICAHSIGRNVDDFILQALIPSVVPVIYLTALSFIPESPVHMCMNHDLPQACSSLQWLRGADYDIDDEIARIQEYTRSKNDHRRPTGANESVVRFASRKTATLIFSADSIFAVLYILYARCFNCLDSLYLNMEFDIGWNSMTNELKLPLVLLLMWLVKHVELNILIPRVFVVNAIGVMTVEIVLYFFEDVEWLWIPCLLNVIISYGNVLLVTLLLWQVFDYIELKSKAIPFCLTMQLGWIMMYTAMPEYDIPSIYFTIINIIVGFIDIQYFLPKLLKRKDMPTKTIFLQNVA